MELSYPAITTCAMLVLYQLLIMNVGRTRAKTGLKAPAVVGHPDFECAYRVQMNTLEWIVLAIPCLWLYAVLGSPVWASVAGCIWIVGRIVYAVAYLRDPNKRGIGMVITMLAQVWLFVGAIWASIMAL